MSRNLQKDFFLDLLENGHITHSNIFSPYKNSINDVYHQNPFYNEFDDNFPIEFLRSTTFMDIVKQHPLYLPALPTEFYSSSELWRLLKINPLIAIAINEQELTASMYAFAIMQDYRLFAFLPHDYQTIELVSIVVNKEPLMLKYVRDDLLLFYICSAAVKKDWRALGFVPTSIIDQGLVNIANANEDAYLLDLVPDTYIDHDMYYKCIMLDAKRTVNFLIKSMLEVGYAQNFVNTLEIGDLITPKLALSWADPKLVTTQNKQIAMTEVMSLRPHWIDYLDPACVGREMLAAVVAQGVYPTLNYMTWTPEMVSTAYSVDRRAILHVPRERLLSLGELRSYNLVVDALENGWSDQVPHHFFTSDIIEKPELNKKLLELRYPYSYILTNAQNIDWNEMLSMQPSIAELQMIEGTAPTEMAESLISHGIEFYAVLDDLDKTLERSVSFLATYPEYTHLLPNWLKEDKLSYRTLLNAVPHLANSMSVEEVVNIYTDE